MAFVVGVIDDGEYATDDAITSPDQKGLAIGLVIKRMRFESDQFPANHPNGRYPIRITRIDLLLEFQKNLLITF
jgi:hypothetical protein